MKKFIASLLIVSVLFTGFVSNSSEVEKEHKLSCGNTCTTYDIEEEGNYSGQSNDLLALLFEFLGIDGWADFEISEEYGDEDNDSEWEEHIRECQECGEKFMAFSPKEEFEFFFEEILGYNTKDLDRESYNRIIEHYEEAQKKLEQEGFIGKDFLLSMSKANQILRAKGYKVPFLSVVDAAESLKSELSKAEYEKLMALAESSLESEDEEEMEKDSLEVDKILSKFGLSARELIVQSLSESVQLALYNVNNGKITRENLDIALDTEKNIGVDVLHQKIWDKIKDLFPSKYMNMIKRFEIATDGEFELSAYVDKEGDASWRLSVDIKDLLDKNGKFQQEAMKTIVHELSHIVSLNKGQMTDNSSDKNLYTVDEGTLKKGSYLNQFYQKFWKDIKIEDTFSYYEKHKDDFVTDYAATNPEEDFSESFAYFVTEDKPKDGSIKSKKVLFFYDYPEFVTMRKDIRVKIGLK